jgi:hypothetical protein
MEHEIVRKLRQELEQGIATEAQVVYVMVKIRKLLDIERDQGGAPYNSLRLYCDWAAHLSLSSSSEAQRIVRMADAFYPKLLKGELADQEKEEFRNVFSLSAFREELNQFLTEKRLPTLSDAGWNAFLAGFLNTVEDCSLICRAKAAGLTEVDEVTIIKEVGERDRTLGGDPPPILWALSWRGHHRLTIDANFARAERGPGP